MSKLFAVLSILFALSGCDLTSQLGESARPGPSPALLRVGYTQGHCFGDCPVFALEVYADAELVYKGERFTDRPGTWRKRGDREEIATLIERLESIDWQQYPARFPSRLPDLATTTITWYGKGEEPIAVAFKEETAPELRRVADDLKRLANEEGYRQVADDVDGKPATAKGAREEIIVLLPADTDAKMWVGNYAKQRVELKERIDPNGNYYLIAADPNVMSAKELLRYLHEDKQVLSAQLNGGVDPR